MKDTKDRAVADRRSFLKLAGLGAAAGGAALAGTRPAEAATDEKKGGLYRETEHVKRYYELARS